MPKISLQLLIASSNKKNILFEAKHCKDDFLLRHTVHDLDIVFQPIAIDILETIREIPNAVIDSGRKQCISDLLLNWLLTIVFENKADGKHHGNLYDGKNANNNTTLLALCNFDAYSNGLNFVFGQAHLNCNVAAIYLPRLQQEFYGLERNDDLFLKRAVKEAVHELGHVFGLGHCPIHRCVMHFSNSISDTDSKLKDFCTNCSDFIDGLWIL
jgi:predicted Zn-dependent protease